ncbi:energy transducer TonB [Paraflavitalea sp. CAU 1676]|uniref:energy transducer TonB n=1 Tax=Paraflavitalea sp. CAU 1676 TaxID=3032598 RepID=UPI0023DBC29F|nr:energy transducer TonB [Paraflavitalea sp. CAU 1676]MDF2192968.1 TonB family protein [Paraflavitalea sp. CAU 1676]
MEISKILTADVLDIIFEGRNKSYGAYELRKTYKRRLLMSISGMLSVLLLFIGGYVFANMGKKEQIVKEIIIPVNELKLIEQDKPQEPPPVKEPPPMKQIETKQFTNIKIAPDEEVKPEEAPPPVDDLDDVKIGTKNVDGFKDDGLAGPPADENAGKGITAVVKKEDPYDDGIFRKVEIESMYPGGPPAWARFLNKNLANNYPQDAIDNEIQGKVEIQFVVDTLGNVSNVEALAGPKELWDAAIRVIKKSGRWDPAIQNGRKVRSYKRQPIIFQLSTE